MALPFLPHYEIRPMFVRLSVLAQTQPLRNLTDYIQEQWIESTIFTPKDWSVFKQPSQAYRGVAQRPEPPSWWPMQITVLPLNRTSSSRSPLDVNNNQACFRQEVEENTEKEVQATPTETIRRLGAVPDRQ